MIMLFFISYYTRMFSLITTKGFMINPRSILRMRIQKIKAAWMELRFESKAQSTEAYRKWVKEVLSVPDVENTLVEASVRKAFDISMSIYVNRRHADLELLISLWSLETHTLVTSWGEFTPTSEDVLVIFLLKIVVYNGVTSIVLSMEEDGTL